MTSPDLPDDDKDQPPPEVGDAEGDSDEPREISPEEIQQYPQCLATFGIQPRIGLERSNGIIMSAFQQVPVYIRHSKPAAVACGSLPGCVWP